MDSFTWTRVKENWLTRKPPWESSAFHLMCALVFLQTGLFALSNHEPVSDWLAAKGSLVFAKHEYWRLWTTLFLHADLAHLLSNSLLLVPLGFWLTAYFGSPFFPLLGVFFGGIVNWFVLQTLPPDVELIGISGVVYWMGAAWLTLYLFIDRRLSVRRRLGLVLVAGAVLFIPETYHPEVSYLSHFIGFFFGVVSALGFYLLNRRRFKSAEILEIVVDEDSSLWES